MLARALNADEDAVIEDGPLGGARGAVRTLLVLWELNHLLEAFSDRYFLGRPRPLHTDSAFHYLWGGQYTTTPLTTKLGRKYTKLISCAPKSSGSAGCRCFSRVAITLPAQPCRGPA